MIVIKRTGGAPDTDTGTCPMNVWETLLLREYVHLADVESVTAVIRTVEFQQQGILFSLVVLLFMNYNDICNALLPTLMMKHVMSYSIYTVLYCGKSFRQAWRMPFKWGGV